jgi:hypothetical protein
MKRLLGLVILFVVLSVCVPSYGYFLIYNVSTTVKGADDNTGAKTTIPLKGYLVLNLDANDALVDANLIMYGNDANTPKKQKVYVQLNQSNDPQIESLAADVWYIGDFIFVDFWNYNFNNRPLYFEILLQGKVALKDIGFGASEKKQVAGSIKGVNMVLDGFQLGPDPNQDVSGTANASATLDLKATQYVNFHSWTQETIILNGDSGRDGLIQILQGKGFVATTLPPPPPD